MSETNCMAIHPTAVKTFHYTLKCPPHVGARVTVRGSLKTLRCIIWKPWMPVLNFVASVTATDGLWIRIRVQTTFKKIGLFVEYKSLKQPCKSDQKNRQTRERGKGYSDFEMSLMLIYTNDITKFVWPTVHSGVWVAETRISDSVCLNATCSVLWWVVLLLRQIL